MHGVSAQDTGAALLLAAALLTGCAALPPAEPPPVAAVLAPFEDGSLPWAVRRLPLDPARSYLLLAQVPSPVPFDLSDPPAMRDALRHLITGPPGHKAAGTTLGHMMIGWSCSDGARGLTSKTGGYGLSAIAMGLSGWGVGALLSTFTDGYLEPLESFPADHARVLASGRAVLVAAEVRDADCAALRGALVDYVLHPGAPARRYTMVRDPAEMTGDGCLTFAMWLATQGGLPPGLTAAVTRPVELRDSFLGRGWLTPGDVEPFMSSAALSPVPLSDLWSADWSAGTPAGRIDLVDGELILAGLVALREAAGAGSAFHRERVLTDAAAAGAEAAFLDWAREYDRWLVFDPDGQGTVILERAP